MYPVIAVYGKAEIKEHFREIVQKLCDDGLPVIACWASTKNDFSLLTLPDDVVKICNVCRVVDAYSLYLREFRGENIMLIELCDAEFDSDELRKVYEGIISAVIAEADILFTVGDYPIENSVNIMHATQTAFELISGVVKGGV